MSKSQQKLDALIASYESRKGEDGRLLYFITEDTSDFIHSRLNEIRNGLDINNLDMAHEVMNDATTALDALELGELKAAEPSELAEGTANVYTAAQLALIDIWNQDEIASIVRECDMDIGTSAAIWYERKVAEAIDGLKAFIFED